MQTFSHLWQYLAKLFLERETFEIKVVEKIKIHILCPTTFFRKSCRLCDNVEKCGGAREATIDVTIRRIRVAYWISKATCTHAHAHAHAPGQPYSRACPYRQICNTYCSSTAIMIRERALVLRCTYIACLVWIVCDIFCKNSGVLVCILMPRLCIVSTGWFAFPGLTVLHGYSSWKSTRIFSLKNHSSNERYRVFNIIKTKFDMSDFLFVSQILTNLIVVPKTARLTPLCGRSSCFGVETREWQRRFWTHINCLNKDTLSLLVINSDKLMLYRRVITEIYAA